MYKQSLHNGTECLYTQGCHELVNFPTLAAVQSLVICKLVSFGTQCVDFTADNYPVLNSNSVIDRPTHGRSESNTTQQLMLFVDLRHAFHEWRTTGGNIYRLFHLFWASLSACRWTFEPHCRWNGHVWVVVCVIKERPAMCHCAVTLIPVATSPTSSRQ